MNCITNNIATATAYVHTHSHIAVQISLLFQGVN